MKKVLRIMLYLSSAWMTLTLGMSHSVAAEWDQIQYMSNEEFIAHAFPDAKPQWKFLILNAELKKKAEAVLGHPYKGTRIRYWVNGERVAWIFDEIGKDLPITLGYVITGNAIDQVKVLVFREERGGEIHEAFFTDQFHQVGVDAQGNLTKQIDGITGATLSVNAVVRASRLVLELQKVVLAKASAS